MQLLFFFFFNDTATTEIYTLSLHDALPIYLGRIHIHRMLQPKGTPNALHMQATFSFLADRDVGIAVVHLDLPVHGQTSRTPIRGIQHDESQLGGTCLE